MVVFTCNHCGESLQKPKVEKHYQIICRTFKNLTCVDCFKDFRGEEYVVHTKCITEEERYAAKGSHPNGVVKKGEVKQESWVEMIKSIISKEPNMQAGHRNLLNTIANYSNVPRKKAKFINFVKSSSGGRVNMKDVEAVWDIIEKYKSAQSANSTNNSQENGVKSTSNKEIKNASGPETQASNGLNVDKQAKKRKHSENGAEKTHKLPSGSDDEAPTTKKNKKKEKNDAGIQQVESTQSSSNLNGSSTNAGEQDDKFSFANAILSILEKKPDMSLIKLEKKFVKLYTKHFGEVENIEKVSKKFNKKLKKLSNVVVSDNKVTYVKENC